MRDDETPSSHARIAIQHLVWALEEIEKSGDRKAGEHARAAIKSLQDALSPPLRAK